MSPSPEVAVIRTKRGPMGLGSAMSSHTWAEAPAAFLL